jgi:AraC-like DNA-binding protein
MENKHVYPKSELKRIIKRFFQDKNRGISIALFADLAGLSHLYLREIFLYETEPLSVNVQRRVDRAYKAWVKGEVAIMQNRDTSKFVQYRKEAKPVMQRGMGLKLENGQFKVSVGVKPKYDYSGLTLDEQLERG